MTTYTLPRSGRAAVAFEGELLAQQTGPYHLGRERDRYVDLAVYRTRAGRLVLHRHYATTRHESERDEVVLAPTILALELELRDWPLEERLPLTAIPAEAGGEADRWRDKRAAVHRQLRRVYTARVEALLQSLAAATAQDPR